MDRNETLAKAISNKKMDVILGLVFDSANPKVNDGYKTETDLWDFKADCPRPGGANAIEWAEIAKDILAFCNNRGGVLFFGIQDSDFSFCGAHTVLDSKIVNDQVRKYLGDKIWVEFHRAFIQRDQRYLGIALIPPRKYAIERFLCDSPKIDGKHIFRAGDTAYRDGDSSKLVKASEINALAHKVGGQPVCGMFIVNQPFFRILAPDYVQFVERKIACEKIDIALRDPRSAVTSVAGIGGIGKTALATWAVLKAHQQNLFHFIVSITAKDRELTSAGIQGLTPSLTSFESLLDTVLEVLEFQSAKSLEITKKESAVKDLLKNSGGLLFVDNLETVDDDRIIAFLNDLPVGVKAIVTTRRSSVRVSVHPVEPGPMTDEEVGAFISTLAKLPGLEYVRSLAKAERERIGKACNYTPLAARWVISRSRSTAEALAAAESIVSSGRRGEELLEFCFRRVFDQMSGAEREVLKVLSVFQSPLSMEAIMIGSGLPTSRVLDSIEQFEEDGLVLRFFDADRSTYTYRLIPMGRSFVYSDLRKTPGHDDIIRKRMSEWFEATDISSPSERLIVREMRNGKSATENGLLDLGIASEKRGDLDTAKRLYEDALARFPKSWKSARLLAEFFRHKDNNMGRALQLYEQAASHAPAKGPDRALIFREWGMLLRDSGEPGATDRAVSNFELALKETPNDPIAKHALGHMLFRKGQFRRVIELLEPLLEHGSLTTREKTRALLVEAYDRTGDIVKAAELRSKQLGIARRQN